MTHDEAQELVGADPENASPELLEHLKSCPECKAYHEQMLALNAKLRRALELDWSKVQRTSPPRAPSGESQAPTAMPHSASQRPISSVPRPAPSSPPTQTVAGQPASAAGTPQPVAVGRDGQPAATQPATAGRDSQYAATQRPEPQPSVTPAAGRSNVAPLRRKEPAPVAKHKSPRLLAVAASLAAALMVGFTLWLSRPPESLAAEIVKHVEGEPISWSKTEPVTAQRLAAVLRKSGVKLGAGMQPVVYANSCWFRGHFVPHFVVTTQDGPVTVMILAHEQVKATQHFNEDGYSGLLVPAPTGGVAVVSRTPMPLEEPASTVVKALEAADQGTSTALPSRL